MNKDLIELIKTYPKKTIGKIFLKTTEPIDFPNSYLIGDKDCLIFGDIEKNLKIIEENKDKVISYYCEYLMHNSQIPLMNIKSLKARIEPGAIIREHCNIQDDAIILMGAVVNIGAKIGRSTMIDMNAVIGSRAQIGAHCHIGAGAVISGVLEPLSAQEVIIEDHVMVGANAVILEGVKVGHHAVIGAGAVVLEDVIPYGVVVGNPARLIKISDEKTKEKTLLNYQLREERSD